ncbi:MAG: Diguanylate cyclase (GGDEF) domain-containing protein [candidate division CPR2 bacterium GW2011_GWC1_39_9]|uniref:Diguanylate cyclase (GGDEF) domain-containing protein n=1 Tax=candidate division CPR2 bacterium GW2011_GWC2_39_10 TaxID=1618345 RepID=A0A0G0M3P7_UNCC2|nr:MAG: Diguanylate cyclase (GGDEF) domain-containing protein [candidate division CPR2 bacterium GW2011_GWC2_39_10]KKR34787.1 MAG: Diguanylate cyclase (GGDEF) domain-containing protein [candidate division CPR2 bacterium GW2011_GWC1_39_9]
MIHVNLKEKERQWIEEIEKIASSDHSIAERIEAVKLLSSRIGNYLKEAGDNVVIDELTGFVSQAFLGQFLDKKFQESQSFNEDLTIVVLHLKLFSVFWDSFGDMAAASASSLIADIIEKSVRSGDVVCRFENDKFVIIMLDTDATQATRISDMIKHEVQITNFGRNDHLGLDFAVVSKNQGYDSPDRMFEQALNLING